MTEFYKTNPLYIKLKDELKTIYKHNFEGMDGFFYVYNKAETYYIEAYDNNSDSFIVMAGLHSIELYDGNTQAYNEEFTLPEFTIENEQDIDNFIEEFNYLVKSCDAGKRCNKIMKAVEKLNQMVEDMPSDMDFLVETLHKTFWL